MHLLDVAPIGGGHYHHHHIKEVIKNPKEVIDTLQNSTVCPDSTANDSISQSVVNGISGSSDDASTYYATLHTKTARSCPCWAWLYCRGPLHGGRNDFCDLALTDFRRQVLF